MKVCATDGMTYNDERSMRTQGGNVRMDYSGRCMRPSDGGADTPARRCQMAKDNKRCPDMTKCKRMVQPADGCCPACGEYE